MGVVSKDLVFSKLDLNNSDEVIHYLAQHLYQSGKVNVDFEAAVKEREKIYPTGLPTGKISVAIPHTDVKYVKQPAIAFATLSKPIKFANMADAKQTVDASVVVMLAMQQPHSQVDMLQKLMQLFQNQDLLTEMVELDDPEQLFEIVSNHID